MKTLVLVDGENIRIGFDQMRAERAVHPEVIEEGELVWNPTVTKAQVLMSVFRVSYFTTVTGDEPKVAALKKTISETHFRGSGSSNVDGYLVPRVYKKPKKTMQSKSVDQNIAIEALRHAYSRSIDRLFLMSGDGDYEPLIKEVMGQGIQVVTGALSNGCSPVIPVTGDRFLDLDRYFFRA